jgi:hypothetical protein
VSVFSASSLVGKSSMACSLCALTTAQTSMAVSQPRRLPLRYWPFGSSRSKRNGLRNQIVELLEDRGRPREEPTLDVESKVCGPPRDNRSRDRDGDPFSRR